MLPTVSPHRRGAGAGGSSSNVYFIILVAVVALYVVIRIFTTTPATSMVTFGRKYCYHVYGYTRDPLFQRLKCWERELYKQRRASKADVTFAFGGPVMKVDYIKGLVVYLKRLGIETHTRPPLVWEGCSESDYTYIGSGDDLISLLRQRHLVEPNQCW